MAKLLKHTVRASKGPKAEPSETCFVMMSFNQLPKSYYQQIFGPAISAAGLMPRRADDIFMPSPIISDIWREVRNARVMLADLTFRNPNVMYELGLAHALGKPVVMLTQQMADVPFDLQSYRVIEYAPVEPDWAKHLAADITKTLKEVLKAPVKWVLPVFLLEREIKDQPAVPHLEKRLSSLERAIERVDAQMLTKASAPIFPYRPTALAWPSDANLNIVAGSLGRSIVGGQPDELGVWRIGQTFGRKPEEKSEK